MILPLPKEGTMKELPAAIGSQTACSAREFDPAAASR
jgi:hypothetical protein